MGFEQFTVEFSVGPLSAARQPFRLHLPCRQNACGDLFGAFARIEDSLSSLRGLEAGRLRLAVSTSGKYFAPRLLAAFVQRHPNVEVSLQIHNRQRLIERLTANADDLYLFVHPPADHELVRQPAFPNQLPGAKPGVNVVSPPPGTTFDRSQNRYGTPRQRSGYE